MLQETGIGYCLEKKGPEVNHLLFMDDLKLFTKNESQIDSLVQTVCLCCKDIGIWNLVLQSVLWKRRESRGINLPTGDSISYPEESGYKYLGVLKLDSILDGKMKEVVKDSYMSRLKLLLKSKLNCRNLIMSINMWDVAVVRYNVGVIGWTKMELEEMDRNTRQLLIQYDVIHPRANVLRLYTPRKLGGRGLIGVEECVASERRSLDLYVASSEEELLKYIATTNNLVD